MALKLRKIEIKLNKYSNILHIKFNVFNIIYCISDKEIFSDV